MSNIQILVAFTSASADILARVIADRVDSAFRSEITLVGRRIWSAEEIYQAMSSVSADSPCALILVGQSQDTGEITKVVLAEQANLVVLQVDIVGDNVRLDIRDPRLDDLLLALRELVDRMHRSRGERMKTVLLEDKNRTYLSGLADSQFNCPLLIASARWLHALLYAATLRTPDDCHAAGFATTRSLILHALEENYEPSLDERSASENLERVLAKIPSPEEPLAALFKGLRLNPLEFRFFLLALAPELDVRFQRCLGFLQDDMGRRAGTVSLYCWLLGESIQTRMELIQARSLWNWRLFENFMPASDELLRIDPYITQWILGDRGALLSEPRIGRILRTSPWPGSSILLDGSAASINADLKDWFKPTPNRSWLVLSGNHFMSWRALLEAGRGKRGIVRVELARMVGMDWQEAEDCAIRVARIVALTSRSIVVDAANLQDDENTEASHLFLATLNRTRCGAVLICRDHTSFVSHLRVGDLKLLTSDPLSPSSKTAAVMAAAQNAKVVLSPAQAIQLQSQCPLTVDRLEQISRIAGATGDRSTEPSLRFLTACKQVATGDVSKFVERIEPVFELDQLVLPRDRKSQLQEIVNHVEMAAKVMDEWKFGLQLPYGRGVTALFYGPSGTGKTMAAMGIAKKLQVQLLKLDLSRVVSKYIGETEKHIDQVFKDAESSHAAILIDEADVVLSKRSEVKDAHDRYANIEVAYLLQRIESFSGVAILTTNMRQNMDSAFSRRLRFVIDFPRPSLEAREQIWRFCLPQESHDLDDSNFRVLAKKIDLTGGHIRQITLRAAFLAVAEGNKICMSHIDQAAQAEFAKLGMPPVDLHTSDRRVA